MGDIIDLFPQPEKEKPLKLTPRGEKVVGALNTLKERVAKPVAAAAIIGMVGAGTGVVAAEALKGKSAEIQIVPKKGQPYRLVHVGQEFTNPRTHQAESLMTETQVVEAAYGDRIPAADGVNQLRTEEQIGPELQPGEEIRLSQDAAIGELIDPNASHH